MATRSAPSGGPGRIARRIAKRAQQSARVLREEFDRGARGETDGPTPLLWDRPTFAHLTSLVRAHRNSAECTPSPDPIGWVTEEATPAPGPEPDTTPDLTAEEAAEEVSTVLERIDWRAVSTAAATDRTAEVTERLKSLAGEVDWDRIKPVAGKVATALVAAAATGHLGRLSGPTAHAVARAINGDQAVGEAAASILARRPGGTVAADVMRSFLGDRPNRGEPPVASVGSTEPTCAGDMEVIPPVGFEARLAELSDLAG